MFQIGNLATTVDHTEAPPQSGSKHTPMRHPNGRLTSSFMLLYDDVRTDCSIANEMELQKCQCQCHRSCSQNYIQMSGDFQNYWCHCNR